MARPALRPPHHHLMGTVRICSVDGCGRKHDSRGFCTSHARRALRLGLIPIVQPKSVLAETLRDRLYRHGWNVMPSGCWDWAAARRHGYGCLGAPGNAGTVQAHRASYEVHVGPIPDGLFVMHTCDNPPCVNPDHLRLGTPRDNMADMIAKGRDNFLGLVVGRSGGRPKLTADAVGEIRRLAESGVPRSDLVNRFGISKSQVGKIVSSSQWTSTASPQGVPR